MKKRRYLIAAICCLYGILNTSCGIFHPPKRDNGYLVGHYYSCGPVALSRALDAYAQKNKVKYNLSRDSKSISIEIQDDRKFIDLVELLVLLDKDTSQITWPNEIKKCLKARSIDVREISDISELKDEIAILLVREKCTIDTYHWIVYPWDSVKYYGDKTVISRMFVLIPKS